jgi:hypothetical protein
MKPKAKFLTAVWGETYVARFAALALPSFLAPGNLPALAEATELEVVILTAQRDLEFFERHAAFLRLRTVCPVRFVHIDDLIVGGVYGVTLTLAYARAMFQCGGEMLDTHFVFMNADFVLADGSLRTLAAHIVAGRPVVLAPSFRATAEALETGLRRAVRSGVLAMPPREMLSLAMRRPHPTTVAKTVTQGLCHTVHPNQFFWQVDPHTLLGRYYLIFMLCLKPQREVAVVNSFCDYAFIPDLCPDAEETVLGDSDAFFMLELQQRSQEMYYLRFGPQNASEAAATLAPWTTREHRRAARHDIVFHEKDIPPSIDKAKARAAAFIDTVTNQLPPPVSHIEHPYWTGGSRVYVRMAIERRLPLPPEFGAGAKFPASRHVRLQALLTRVHHAVFGDPPLVTPLNPHWLDYQHLAAVIAAIPPAARHNVLVVREWPLHVDRLVTRQMNARFATLNEIILGDYGRRGPEPLPPFSHALVYLQQSEHRYLRTISENCLPLLEPAGHCDVFVHRLRGQMETGDLLHEGLDYLEGNAGEAQIRSMVGSWRKRFNSALFTALGEHVDRYGPKAFLWIVPSLALLLPIIFVTNLLLRLSLPTKRALKSCSSVALTLRAS